MPTPLETQFARLGVRLRVRDIPTTFEHAAPVSLSRRTRRHHRPWLAPTVDPLRLDVRRDGDGEYFDLVRRTDVRLTVPDVRPADRHLLLVSETPAPGTPGDRDAFLCGHDERHWFVAALPNRAGIYDVQTAKDALKPREVWQSMAEHAVPMAHRDLRRTAAFARQGEWFFIPRPDLVIPPHDVLTDEPIRRGAGKPHLCQHLFRTNGLSVYVTAAYPNGLTADEYHALPKKHRRAHDWSRMVRGATVYVRGAIRHPDHQTLPLDGWHEVVMNTETQSRAMRHVAFLD